MVLAKPNTYKRGIIRRYTYALGVRMELPHGKALRMNTFIAQWAVQSYRLSSAYNLQSSVSSDIPLSKVACCMLPIVELDILWIWSS